MVTSREIVGNRFALRIERYARWKMFDHILSRRQWVKQIKYTGVTLLLKIPFGRNKCTYKQSINPAPSCRCMYAHLFCGLPPFPFVSEGSGDTTCPTAHQWLSSKGDLGLLTPDFYSSSWAKQLSLRTLLPPSLGRLASVLLAFKG